MENFQLEVRLINLKHDLQTALSARNFELAQEIQEEIDDLETVLGKK